MMRHLLLSGGLFLTAATQLRIPGLPIGPGEILLVGWLGLGLLFGPSRGRHGHPGLAPVLLFWAVFSMSLGVGAVVSFANELFFDTSSIIHDIGAYVLGVAVASMLLRDLAEDLQRRRIVWQILAISTAALSVQILQGLGLFGVPGIEPWYFNRFQGWSENPNMLGLLSAFVVLLAVFGMEIAIGRGQLGLALLACGLALFTGLLTRSDSFALSILVGGSICAGMKMWDRLKSPRVGLGSAVATVFLLSTPFVLVSAAPFAPDVMAAADAYTKTVYEDNGQGETRLNLWREAVGKGLESGLLGYGPGPHLTSKSFKRPPPDKFEAHNTFLDIFTQGGLLAVVAFIALLGATFTATIRAGLAPLVALACGLLIFSLFHFVVRQPIFWFGLVLCLVEAETVLRRRKSAIRVGGPLEAGVVC